MADERSQIVFEGRRVVGQSGDLAEGCLPAEIHGQRREQTDEKRGDRAGDSPPHEDAHEGFEDEGNDDRDDGGYENDAGPIEDGDDDAGGYGGEGVAVDLLLNGTLRFLVSR